MCNYIISFSSALAVLNVIPSMLLDGQHMMQVLLGRKLTKGIVHLLHFMLKCPDRFTTVSLKLLFINWAENFRMLDIEINAWSSLFLNLKTNLILSCILKRVKNSANQSRVSETGKLEISRTI